MTAYARKSFNSDLGDITWEIRAVNHRYRELSLRLPEALRHLEPKIREIVASKIARGKLDICLKFNASAKDAEELVLNKALADNLQKAANELAINMPNPNTNITQLLSWPGLLNNKQEADKELDNIALQQLATSLDALCDLRQTEGKAISECLQEILQTLGENLSKIESAYPEITANLQNKLRHRLEESKADINKDRFEQEVVYWLNKIDVAEECQRFSGHLQAVTELVQQAEPIGRKLDFYAQELNREANTIGSKLSDMDIAQHIVHIKVAIEQLREQAQNIE